MASSFLFYSKKDIERYEWLLAHYVDPEAEAEGEKYEITQERRQEQKHELFHMQMFCENKDACLRLQLLGYLGEDFKA